jgi:hypothetical protein
MDEELGDEQWELMAPRSHCTNVEVGPELMTGVP